MKKLFTRLLMAVLFLTSTMKISQAAVNRLKTDEGFRPTAYKDSRDGNGVQLYSIGYGHQIRPHEPELRTAKISVAKGEQLLRSDIAPLELQINAAFPKGMKQNQFDVAIQFGYNCGSGALGKGLAKWKASGNPKAFTDYTSQYVHTKDNDTGKTVVSQTLVKRRESEVSRFNNPIQPVVLPVVALVGVAAAYLFLT